MNLMPSVQFSIVISVCILWRRMQFMELSAGDYTVNAVFMFDCDKSIESSLISARLISKRLPTLRSLHTVSSVVHLFDVWHSTFHSLLHTAHFVPIDFVWMALQHQQQSQWLFAIEPLAVDRWKLRSSNQILWFSAQMLPHVCLVSKTKLINMIRKLQCITWTLRPKSIKSQMDPL